MKLREKFQCIKNDFRRFNLIGCIGLSMIWYAGFRLNSNLGIMLVGVWLLSNALANDIAKDRREKKEKEQAFLRGSRD